MNIPLTLLAAAASALIGSWFARHVWRAMATGSANVHNAVIRRHTRPAFFWLAVIVQGMFGALLFANAWRMAHQLFMA